METKISEVLNKTGMIESNIIKKEENELGEMLSLEEIIERRKELAKMKSVIFYEEKKRQRINKIKSKMYHKIRKKQEKRALQKERDALRETDPELAKKLDEEDEYKRAKERVTLKHSTQNKWANRNMKYAKNNQSIKEAINEHLHASEELKKKIESELEENSEYEDEDLDDLEPEEKQKRINNKLKNETLNIIKEIDDDNFEEESKHSSLYKYF